MTDWLLVRHGESENNGLKAEEIEKRVPSPRLTTKGRTQAQAFADAFVARDASLRKGVPGGFWQTFHHEQVRLVSSPMVRALETIEPLARRLGRSVVIEPDLFERGGVWEQTTEESTSKTWGELDETFAFALLPVGVRRESPWYQGRRETWDEAAARVQRLLKAWTVEAGAPTVAVCHCDVLDIVLRLAKGEPIDAPLRYRTPNTGAIWIRSDGRAVELVAQLVLA